MKHLRRSLSLLLCLAMTSAASTAAAAKSGDSAFTEAPTLKITAVPADGTPSGGMDSLSITASLPGFLSLYLLDAGGSIALTLAENQEIHSDLNLIDFDAVGDDGEPLAPGTYTLSAEMTSQYGVASKTVTGEIEILENEEAEDDEEAAEAAEDEEEETKAPAKSADSKETEKSDNKKSDSKKNDSKKNDSKKDSKTSTVLEYGEGSYSMGDEGLLIGVGVSDTAAQENAGYWGLTADASDEDIWAALTRTMMGVDVGENESAYIYDSPESGRKKLGTVSGLSQAVNVVKERDDGWALVEAFRNEDGAFVRGYIKADKLRVVEPNLHYGIVIDKATQTLTVYKDGERLGSCKVSTGLPTAKYPHRETPAGEYILVTRRGSYEYYGMGYTRYTIRLSGGYYLAEIPTTKKNGSKFLEMENELGEKATRGTVCVAHDASTDGGINAEWIWDMTDENKKVKVLIFDDKPRTDVPLSDK
ncbi:MAG: L,D-transpeptidase [Christensenellales bacterium]|nr:L,D-transpeptidase [Christensenellales bacterium]